MTIRLLLGKKVNIRSVKFSLWSATSAMGITTIAVLAWPVLYSATVPSIARQSIQPVMAVSPKQLVVTSDQFESVLELGLQEPLYDRVLPPPIASPSSTRVTPNLDIILAGTALEARDPRQSRAFLQTPDGKTLFKRVGDRAGEATVLEINNGSVVVSYYGSNITLKVKKKGG